MGPTNVQNIPKEDVTVKRAFCPKLDALLSCDFPNIELKLLAFYLEKIGHPSMAQFFRDDPDADLHVVTAAAIFRKDQEKVTKHERQVGKRVNFSIVYGGGTPTLVEQGVAPDFPEALELLRGFHRAWPGIGWATKRRPADKGTLTWYIHEKVDSRGYITTLWGRHLHPRSPHAALNALVQGCAADLMKWACIQIHNYIKAEDLQSHLVNVIHDDALMDCIHEELPLLARNIPDQMTYEPLQAVVPIRPEPEVSYTTWADLEPYKEAT